jgi:hypothetical protein
MSRSPVTGLFCHRHLADMFLSLPGRADLNSARLDASIGASGPHDFAVRDSVSRQRAGYRSQVFRPALRSHRAQTLPRPPHPIPTSVTIMIRPSCGVGWREFVEMICPTGIAKYFCKRGWTRLSTKRPTGKSLDGNESTFRACPGRGAASFTLLRRAGTHTAEQRHDGPRLSSAPASPQILAIDHRHRHGVEIEIIQ